MTNQTPPSMTANVNFPAYFAELQESRIIRTAADDAALVDVAKYLENPVRGQVCSLFAKNRFQFLPGDVTIWGGISGHGKSLIVGQVMSQLMMMNQRVFVASLEMLPRFTFLRMMRQAFGRPVTKADLKDMVPAWFAWARSRLVYLDKVGTMAPDEILGCLAYAAQVYRCKHLVVDNLMRVVSGEDDYNGQKRFVEQCCEIAMSLGVHIHLVHHVRKGETEDDEIGKFSLRGASSVADQAANIVLIQRVLAKERKRNEGRLGDEEDKDVPDVHLSLVKHRNGDWQGRVPLWFCPQSTAYSTSPERTVPRLWNGDTENLEDVPF